MYAMLGDVRFETLQSFASLEAQHGLPVMDPLRFGVERVVEQALA